MLKRLRAEPHHIKQRVSFIIAAVIFSAIVFVWVSSRDARSRELEVQAKTVSPLDGVSSMFDGIAAGFKKKISGPVGGDTGKVGTSTDNFDLSGVVVIDPLATTTATTTKATGTPAGL